MAALRLCGLRFCVMALSLCVSIVVASSALAAEGDTAFNAEVQKVLEVGWGKNFLVLEPAREHYEKAIGIKASDPLAPYAFALAHVKQNRYVDAKKLAEQAAVLNKQFLPARDLVIFLAVRAKEYESALTKVDELARLLPQQPDSLQADDYLDRARFLGRVFGFLAGPAAVDANNLADHQQKLLERLTEDGKREFASSRKEVEDRFAELRLGRDQSKEEAEASQAEAKKREAERLAKEKEQVVQSKEEVEAQADKAKREAESVISEIEKNLTPLERKLGDLASQAAPIRRRMGDLADELGRLRALSDSTEDPNERFRLRVEIDRLSRLYDRLEREYVVLDREAARVKNELAALEQKRAGAINKYEAVMKKLGKQADNLRKSAARIDRAEDKVAQPPTGNTAGVRATTAVVLSLTTYLNFPLEREKQRVLEALK